LSIYKGLAINEGIGMSMDFSKIVIIILKTYYTIIISFKYD